MTEYIPNILPCQYFFTCKYYSMSGFKSRQLTFVLIVIPAGMIYTSKTVKADAKIRILNRILWNYTIYKYEYLVYNTYELNCGR